MRGDDLEQMGVFSYVSAEQRIAADHPLRGIRRMRLCGRCRRISTFCMRVAAGHRFRPRSWCARFRLCGDGLFHECVHFGRVTVRIAAGVLMGIGKEQLVLPGALRAFETTPGGRHKLRVPLVERCVFEEEQDIMLNPDTFVEIELWAREKLDWLRGYLSLENGIPSHDTFGRLFGLIDPEQFEAAFRPWVKSILPALGAEIVAIDGKTSRRSGGSTPPRCTWSRPSPPGPVWCSANAPRRKSPTRSRPFQSCLLRWR